MSRSAFEEYERLTITELDIQLSLMAHHIGKGLIMIPNYKTISGSELDLLTVTQKGEAREYEIKLSRSDFFADFKKKTKHHYYKRSHEEKRSFFCAPNHFYYVCPEGLLKKDEMPKYAGLIYVGESCIQSTFQGGFMGHKIKIVKRSPKLHKEPYGHMDYIAQQVSNRNFKHMELWAKLADPVRQITR